MYWVTSRRSVWVINKCTFQNNYINRISSQISQIIRTVIKASTKDKNMNAGLYLWKKITEGYFHSFSAGPQTQQKCTCTCLFFLHQILHFLHHPFWQDSLQQMKSPVCGSVYFTECTSFGIYHQPVKQQERNNNRNYNCQILKNILHTTEIQTKTKSGLSL